MSEKITLECAAARAYDFRTTRSAEASSAEAATMDRSREHDLNRPYGAELNTRDSMPALMRHDEYVCVIRPLLPEEAFAPHSSHLWRIAFHMLVVVAGWLVIRYTNSVVLMAVMSLFIGHSAGSMLFLAHDLTHGSILRKGRLRYALQLILWGSNIIPPTLWQCLHNRTHHAETNTVRDPDRGYLASENTGAVRAFNRMFSPIPKRHYFSP